MGGVEIAEHIDSIERDGAQLGDAAAAAGLAAPVPGCPGWQVRDLVRHQAYVHGWAARHVQERLPELIDEADEAAILAGDPPDAELLAAYRAGHAGLVRTLREADPDVECATFMRGAPSPLAFWARRQAHETAIHRFDAQSATATGAPGPAAAFEPAFAADGIDELIMGFAPRRRYRARGDGDWSLAVLAADTGASWRVRLADGGTEVRRGSGAADCVLEGPASGLYTFLWNRCGSPQAGITVSGDPSVLNVWGSSVRVRW
jgi:uncharacterized protein (TIGR03083 family)